jgi:hypothetical protein
VCCGVATATVLVLWRHLLLHAHLGADGGQVDGSLHREESTGRHTYLIGTVESRHRRPLSPSNCHVPAPQHSRYAGEVA